MKTKGKQSLHAVPTLPVKEKTGILDMKSEAELQVKKEIGEKIKQIRRSRRGSLTATVVAQKLGMSRVALTHLENGQNHVNGVNLWKLATILGCGVAEFFPDVPSGHELSQKDVENITKKDKNATKWAEDCFGPAKK